MPLFEVEKHKIPSNLLVDRFLIPPFSVFDTKQGYWQDRKRNWINLGIKSELGRGDNLLFNLSHFNYDDEKRAKLGIANFDEYGELKKITTGKCLPESIGEAYGRKVQATSIFDPVLCEIAYKWFSLPNAQIIDPFAGGSVRGLIAGILGRKYFGIDLSDMQIAANKAQYAEIASKYSNIIEPVWINGDSTNIKTLLPKNRYDLVFSCPPYYNLEVYSDKKEDLSNKATYEDFLASYNQIIKNTCELLNDDCFAIFVVGNMRDSKGIYYDFVGDTIRAFQQACLQYYNEAIIINVAGTLPIRAPKQFMASRKLGKQHQQFLVFYKGDPSHIKDKYGDIIKD